nr:Uncharacterised protein [Salmonella sp. NCTC 7297]
MKENIADDKERHSANGLLWMSSVIAQPVIVESGRIHLRDSWSMAAALLLLKVRICAY